LLQVSLLSHFLGLEIAIEILREKIDIHKNLNIEYLDIFNDIEKLLGYSMKNRRRY